MTTVRKSKNNLWECRCMINYKYIIIGYYSTKELAEIAYNEYVLKHKLNRKLKISS